jgi:nucleotide-binding universal stress UspA family protein
VAVDAEVDEDRDVAGAILARADALGTDVIALGTHGGSGFERLVLGSTAEKVTRRARCAVMTVPPPEGDGRARPVASMDRILCPVEFSAESSRALRCAASIARTSGARVTVLHVLEIVPDPLDAAPQAFSESRAALFQRARAAMARIVTARARMLCAVDQLVLVGKAYREILRMAAEQQADLIVMGRHGRGAIDALFFGSTTQHVMRSAECPVLAVGATDPGDVVAAGRR